MNNRSGFLIAAPKSNSGKTLVTLGLIRALVKKGLTVQPFKCGPDYIDPMHHSIIAGQASYNLDLWMTNDDHVRQLFFTHSHSVDVSIAEGVMGLFDGAKKDLGSSAAVARLLNLPVVLVVDASSVAYSVAPLLYGYKHFDPRVKLAGVIFNKVAGESHYQFLKEAAEDAGVNSLGYVPRDNRMAIESRHLGLHLPGENENIEIVDIASEHISKHVDIDQLLELSRFEFPEIKKKEEKPDKKYTIALAKDQAFNFSYQANRDALECIGKVIEFSPLVDDEVPSADLLWLPGGYPELFAEQLEKNTSMKESIVRHINDNKAVIAECGGMMYLGKSIITKEGTSFEMADVFDFNTSFEDMKLHLGYRQLDAKDFTIKGHEFHYSELKGNEEPCDEYKSITARGKNIEMPVFRKKNCWASYMHLYLGEDQKLQTLLKELGL